MRISAMFMVALLVASCSKKVEIIDGKNYQGKITSSRGTNLLDLTLHRESGVGAISSSLGLQNVAITISLLNEDSIDFSVAGYGVRYRGKFSGDGTEINGVWFQGAKSVPLIFSQQERLPESPMAATDISQEEVSIKVSPSIHLSGTLTKPKLSGQFPALILLGVAGHTDRDQSFGQYKSFKLLAERFTREGFVVLRCDDRGVGKSTGSLYESSYDDLLGDAEAMLAYLRQRTEVDTTKVGALGISEGAALTGLLAGKGHLDFGVLLSYPAMEGYKTIQQQIQDLGKVYEFNESQINLLLADFEKVNGLISAFDEPVLLQNAIKNYLTSSDPALKKLTKYLFVPEDIDEAARLYAGAWYKAQLDYDPATSLKGIRCPVLFLYGTNDPFVNPLHHLPILEKQLAQPRHPLTLVKKLDSVNHIFQDAATGSPLSYMSNGNEFSGKALEEIVSWLSRIK